MSRTLRSTKTVQIQLSAKPLHSAPDSNRSQGLSWFSLVTKTIPKFVSLSSSNISLNQIEPRSISLDDIQGSIACTTHGIYSANSTAFRCRLYPDQLENAFMQRNLPCES